MKSIETLRHGGRDAIVAFVKISQVLHGEGGTDALQDWVTIALSALPERERIEAVTLLLSDIFEKSDYAQSERPIDGGHPTLN